MPRSGEFVTRGTEETVAAGAALAALLRPGDVVLLSGDLGAGKTQLTKGIAAGLGIEDPVTSPTFNIMLVHEGRLALNHFDLYRLNHAQELVDIDYFGAIESDAVSVVEWGDRFAEARPEHGLDVVISIIDDDSRRIEVAGIGERGLELAQAWLDSVGRDVR